MNSEEKVELTPEQISVLIQVINKGTFVGEQIEFVVNLKKTLIAMLKQKQTQSKKNLTRCEK